MVEFEWDRHNIAHLKSHRVSPHEFEEMIRNAPLDLEYETIEGEERYKSLGLTDHGRMLVAVWTLREGKIRAVTAYPASRPLQKLYWGMKQ